MPSFANITEELSNMFAIPSEELSDEQKQTLWEYINELSQAQSDKVDGLCSFLKEQAARAEACKTEALRLRYKAEAINNRIDFLKHAYAKTMKDHDMKACKGKVYSISFRPSQATEIFDEKMLPRDCFEEKVTMQVKKSDILKRLKAGEEIPGARLIERQTITVR